MANLLSESVIVAGAEFTTQDQGEDVRVQRVEGDRVHFVVTRGLPGIEGYECSANIEAFRSGYRHIPTCYRPGCGVRIFWFNSTNGECNECLSNRMAMARQYDTRGPFTP